MCLTTRLPVSRPLVSALDSAFFRRSERKVADLAGQRALLTPHCLPVERESGQRCVRYFASKVSKNLCPLAVLSVVWLFNSVGLLILPTISSLPLFSFFDPDSFPILQFPSPREPYSLPTPNSQLPTSNRERLSLTLSAAASAASVPPHGDDLDRVGDVLEELDGALELHALDGLGGLTGVLEADTQVRAPGAGALSGRNLLSSVTDLKKNPASAHAHIYSRTGTAFSWRWEMYIDWGVNFSMRVGNSKSGGYDPAKNARSHRMTSRLTILKRLPEGGG